MKSGLFHQIEDAAVILQSKGVYRQVKAYQRNGDLYAGHGGGFIRLYDRGNTSVPGIGWIGMDGIVSTTPDKLGRLTVKT